MSGFLDRLAARAVGEMGETPRVHPRVRARFEPRFEPDTGMLPGGVAEETVEVEVAAASAVQRVAVPSPIAVPTFEPEPWRRPAERDAAQRPAARPSPTFKFAPISPDPIVGDSSPISSVGEELASSRVGGKALFSPPAPPPAREGASPSPTLQLAPMPSASRPADPLPPGEGAARPSRAERLRPAAAGEESAPEPESRLRRNPPPLTSSPTLPPALPGKGEEDRANPSVPVSFRVVASTLPGDGREDGRGGRGVRVHEARQSQELPRATERRRLVSSPPESTEPQPSPLRPRSALAEELPTVEPARHASLPQARNEHETSESVVQIHIGRIDVRAAQPPAPERRPARTAGPRLTLESYLKRREERRR